MAEPEIGTYLSHLATQAKVSASTQNQALAALLFLYQQVLDRPLPWMGDVVHAKRPTRVPVVLTRDEARAVLSRLSRSEHLVSALLYGGGLRLLEALQLRVKDVDFARRERRRLRSSPRCDRAQVPRGPARVGLAVDLSRHPNLHRSGKPPDPPPPPSRDRHPTRRPLRRPRRANHKARQPPHRPPPTCWKAATTSAPSRNCSATRTSAPP